MGPWVVRAEILSEDTGSPDALLNEKAVLSMEKFMDGEVEYFVSAPAIGEENSGTCATRPLVFRSFSKADRPKAWKGCDLRIQSTIPVLGIDPSIPKDAEGSDKSECLIRVSMALRNSDGDED